MVVNAGGAASDAEQERDHQGEGPARVGPAFGTRRQLMRGLLAPALALTLAPLVAASRPSQATTGHGAGPAPATGHGAGPTPATGHGAGPARPEPHGVEPAESTSFDETYRGRRIRGIRSAAGRAVGAGTWHVTVDGRPLHLMRRADGSWLSMIDHYRSYPTPLAAARGAVDELGPGEHLRDTPAAAGQDHSGGSHGVHA
ncbi:tyrosinase family oxidase copper chaperone [Streptomyces sp. NPDC058818]|uniref:tyrosinase family oxidase copper chaperone n=1 Tax=Streptomyces sp. NPDC058818 TaxID=3346640 RepID=UPI0036BCD87C